MSRLQRKCMVVSAFVHGLLLVTLAVAPAWVGSRSKIDDLPLLDVIPTKAIDEAFSGGGTPDAVPPPTVPKAEPPPPAAPALPPPEPEPKVESPKPEPKAEPKVEPEPQPKKTPEPLEKLDDPKKPGDEPLPPKPAKTPKKTPPELVTPPPKPEKPRVKVDLTPVRRSNAAAAAAAAERERERERARAEAEAAAARRAHEERVARISGSLQSIQGGVSKPLAPGSVVGIVGPGGEAYANIGQILKSIYYRAWNPPSDLDDDGANVETLVTVARDGSVVLGETRITRRSGVVALDKSVQQALDRVRSVAPLPESTKEPQRTFRVIFSPKAKRLLG
jgi:colicin import membrane protein